MRHRGAGTQGDFMASQIELVHSAHGLSGAGRFRLRLGVFVQSGSLNSVVVVTHAEGRAIGKLLVSFSCCWIYDGSAWAACTAVPPQCVPPENPCLCSQVFTRNGAMGPRNNIGRTLWI